jgi:hypothetical protein
MSSSELPAVFSDTYVSSPLRRMNNSYRKKNVLACISSPRFQRRLVDSAVAELVTTQIAMKILVGTLVNSVVV